MQPKIEESKWIEETAEAILQLLREHFSASTDTHSAWRRAAYITLIYLCRPGWPGADLPQQRKKDLHDELTVLAKPLFYANDVNALRLFAKNATRAVLKRLPKIRPQNIDADAHGGNHHLGKLAAMIKSELQGTKDEATAVSRAAARIFSDEQRQRRRHVHPNLPPDDPLRAVLALPKTFSTSLPKHDVRALMLKCDTATQKGDDVSLMSLINRAAPFSLRALQPALGEELFARCRPVGYADRYGHVVLIEVDSSAMAHEMSFRKTEILSRLKKLRGFEELTDARFVLSTKNHPGKN